MTEKNIEHGTADGPAGDAPSPIQSHIDAYVERLKRQGVIRSAALEHAFRRVPRHRLVESFYIVNGNDYTQIEYDLDNPDPQHLAIIYSDHALITRMQDGVPTSSSSQPGLVAGMLNLLELDQGMNVLEIGAGTGYNAALMAEIVGEQTLITTVDVQGDVIAQTQNLLAQAGYGGIRVVCADGFSGNSEQAPFDRVIVTVGLLDMSPHWVEQLSPTGRILMPLRRVGVNPLVLVSRREGDVVGKVVGWSGFMAIQGKLQDDAYWGFSVPETGLSPTQVPVWPELFQSGDTGWRSLAWGFWFYLGIRDRRTRLANWMPSFGLADPESGHWVNLDHENITVVGDPSLLNALNAYYDEWSQLGSPRIPDFTIHFVPNGHPLPTDHDPGWIVQGRYYAQVFTLTP